MERRELQFAAAALLGGCSNLSPGDPALSPAWPAFSACMTREQAKLRPGQEISKAAVTACNEEGRKAASASRQSEY